MALHRTLLATFALAAAATVTAHGQAVTSTFVINELDSVQTGGNTKQFVELFNNGVAPVNLSEYTLGFYNGSAGGNSLYMSVPLSGMLAVGSYYVVGNTGVANVNLTPTNFTLKTGVNAVILYHGATAPTTPNPTMILNFTDAIVYGQDQLADTGLLTATGEAPFQYNENFGAASGGLGAGAASLSRVNGVDAEPYEIGIPTPGAANQLTMPGVPAVLPIPEPTPLVIVGLATAGVSLLLLRQRQRR